MTEREIICFWVGVFAGAIGAVLGCRSAFKSVIKNYKVERR